MAAKPRTTTKAADNDVATAQGAANDASPTQDNSTTKLVNDAEQATKARERAEKAKVKADADLATAQTKFAEFEAQLTATGKVSQEEYAGAEFEVKRATGTVAEAERVLASAQQDERVKVAIAAAADLVDGTASRQARDEAISQAQTVVADALLALRASVEHRNATLRSAMTQARSAGLVSGTADPASPILVGTHRAQPWQRGEDVLIVDGDQAHVADPSDVAQVALSAAVKFAGLGLDISKVGARR